MSFQHKPGSFSLFKADKGDNPARPDYTGEGKDLDGNDIRVSAWLKDGAKGKFMSCKFDIKQAQVKLKDEKPSRNAQGALPDGDDIPFAPMK